MSLCQSVSQQRLLRSWIQLCMIIFGGKKPHYLKKDVIRESKEEGGLEVLDFTVLNNTFKIKWIIEF